MRFGGRATVTVPPFAMAVFEACLALLGGFFADMDGEGEEEEAAPFVCMPVGNRFVLGCGGRTGGGMGVVLGAIATVCYPDIAQRAAGQAPRPDAGTGCGFRCGFGCGCGCGCVLSGRVPNFFECYGWARFGRICSGGF